MFWFYLIFGNIIPAIMVIIGAIFKSNPPGEINLFMGYRTTRSMKSKEAWDFANKYSGKLMFICGLILLILSALVIFFFRGESEDTQGIVLGTLTVIQMFAVIATIIPVEKALRKRFDEQGRPRF